MTERFTPHRVILVVEYDTPLGIARASKEGIPALVEARGRDPGDSLATAYADAKRRLYDFLREKDLVGSGDYAEPD